MQTAMEEKTQKKKLLLVILIIAVLLVALLGTTFAVSASKLNYDKIYEGIYVGDVNVSALSEKEAQEAILKEYVVDNTKTFTIVCEGAQTTLSLGDLALEVDAEKSAKEAFSLAREGSFIKRLKEIASLKKNSARLDVSVKCEDALLSMKINELSTVVDEPERELSMELLEDEILITKGADGNRIIEESAKKQIIEAILSGKEDRVELKKEKVDAKEPTLSHIKETFCKEAKDASYKIENHRLTIEEETIGVSLNDEETEKILSQEKGDIILIPVEVTKPKITTETIKAELFPDLLATYSSRYDAGNVSRSHNVALASKFINEIVLAPGDIFSYNDIVGPRTAERGFREAGVYVGNKVEQGIGGGICQVSSTLFNTAVLSDLKIVYRTSHSLPVSYVPLGRDATVSYGTIDFKFENSTAFPIKIIASAVGGKNTVSIYGKKENKARTIEISTQCIATYEPRVEQTEDASLPLGEIKVIEKGAPGSSYITYKITKENGKTIKTETLTKSKYSATDRVEVVGTMEVPSLPTHAPITGDVAQKPENMPKPMPRPEDNSEPTQKPEEDKSGASQKPNGENESENSGLSQESEDVDIEN